MWVLLIFALFALSAGGCGGGGGGSSTARGVGIVSAKISDPVVDAYGYVDVEAVIESDAGVNKPGLAVALFAAPSGGGEEELLASAWPQLLNEGSETYWLRLAVEPYAKNLAPLNSGEYVNARLALVPDEKCALVVDGARSRVEIGETLSYRAAGDAPLVVKGSLTADVKDAPRVTGAEDANVIVDEEKGWSRVVAGRVNGEQIVVAWTATVDIVMELARDTYDVEAIEIWEDGGALIVQDGTPVDVLRWEGPFKSGEVGRSFEVMYWGNETPPDIGTLNFSVRPIPASGALANSRSSGFYETLSVWDEPLRITRSRVAAVEINSPRQAASDDKLMYRDFASMVWQLWRDYELTSGTWDTDIGPAYWYAHLVTDLSKIVDWNTAIAESPVLSEVKMKHDFFASDRPINLFDSSSEKNHKVRVPKVYAEAEKRSNELFSKYGFPYGHAEYMKWWTTLPQWMIKEAIFVTPARSYANLKIGDMVGDDYLWQIAFPKFLKVAGAYGTGSVEYSIFWHESLGVRADGDPELSRTREEYQDIFPKVSALPDSNSQGGSSANLPDISQIQAVRFQYGKEDGSNYAQYRNNIVYAKGLGDGSKYFYAGFEFSYDDGVKLLLSKNGSDHSVGSSAWTRLEAGTPVKLLGISKSPFYSKAEFTSDIQQEAEFKNNTVTWKSGDGSFTEDSRMLAQVEFYGKTLFERELEFVFHEGAAEEIDKIESVSYPLYAYAYDSGDDEDEDDDDEDDPLKITVYGVEIELEPGIEGSAGLDFVYYYGQMKSEADNPGRVAYSKPIGLRVALEPNADLGVSLTLSVGTPLKPPIPAFKFSIGCEVNLIEMSLPLYHSRVWGFKAEKLEIGNTSVLPGQGKWYYSLGAEKDYGLKLNLAGLEGEVKFEVESSVYENEWPLFEWDGVSYAFPLLNKSYGLPLSIAASDK
jgi:hypothetical protein